MDSFIMLILFMMLSILCDPSSIFGSKNIFDVDLLVFLLKTGDFLIVIEVTLDGKEAWTPKNCF